MHGFIVNASIQLVPLANDKHPYEWVDEVIEVIQQSGLPFEVGPFATVVEGRYAAVMDLINSINEHLLQRECPEWITSIQIQIRSNADITGEEKTAKFFR